MKHRLITIVGWLFLVTSVGLLLYPEIISFIKQKQSDQIAQELEKNTGRRKNDDSLYQKALRYNEKIREDGQKDMKDVWSYQAPPIVLRKEQDTFGYIKIPKMKQKLPLYLGATMENMRKGATIMGQTSLPLGKRDSNCVIAAHRGYQGIPYFRDIEELKAEVSDHKFFICAYNIALLPYYSERRALPFTCCFVKSSHIKHK